jgi:hypothetical protein
MKNILIEKKIILGMDRKMQHRYALRDSFDCFIGAIKNDPELKHAYICNIAMKFYDEYFIHQEKSKKKYMSKNDIHIISNESAKQFMELLCSFVK